MATLIAWLREVADPIDPTLLDDILDYESGIDGEFACCHTAGEIEQGKCTTRADDIRAVRTVGTRYAHEPGYLEDWRPAP